MAGCDPLQANPKAYGLNLLLISRAGCELAGAQPDSDSEPSVPYTVLPPECLPPRKQPHLSRTSITKLYQTEVSYRADICN